MSTIPAELFVNVDPSVLAVGGTGNDILGLMLTTNPQVPVGVVLECDDTDSVSAYFGPASTELALAEIYFAGFDQKDKTPSRLFFAQYNTADVGAYLRGGSVAALTLLQLQAINGTLIVPVDGTARNGGTINLSSATSPSSAAALIQTGLNSAPATLASFTGSIGTTTLNVTAVASGVLAAGQTVIGGATVANTRIVKQLTGAAGGIGTYQVSISQTVASGALTTQPTPVVVTYDSVSGGFVVSSAVTGAASSVGFATGTISALLELTAATGAVLSQGAVAQTDPVAFMNVLAATNSVWTNFMTMFDPDSSGNTVKQAFASWKNTKNQRFGYVCWDLDQSPLTQNPANSSLGQILAANGDSGTFLLGGDTAAGWSATTAPQIAAFVMGVAASIDFEENNGRTDFAYRSQAGLPAYVSTSAGFLNLCGNPQAAARGNNYNCYGAVGSAGSSSSSFLWLQRGFVTGPFAWFDSYCNQVWLNSFFKLLALTYFNATKSTPYDPDGYSALEQMLMPAVNQGLAFRAFAPGTISTSQIQQVNEDAGADIATTLQTQGWYLQISAASDAARAARTSPPATFYYLDRGSVQALDLSSIMVQ
jgi:hypothetical protein